MIRTPQEVFAAFPVPAEGPLPTEKAKSEITIGCTDQVTSAIDRLRQSMDSSASENSRLSRHIFWLNIVLTVATVVGTVVAVLSFVFRK